MKVYVVWENNEGWLSDIFGVRSTREKAEALAAEHEFAEVLEFEVDAEGPA
jgi:hypothetical protein